MAHDQQEFRALEELLYKREQAIQELTCELCTHRMMASLSRNANTNDGSQFDFPTYDYPPLKCNVNEVDGPDGDFEDVELGTSFKNTESISQVENFSNRNVDETSDIGDDTTDRICIIDSIYHGAPHNSFIENKASIGVYEDSSTNPRDSMDNADGDPEIKKLYMRLQALEADRESTKRAIISMRTDKAQLVLLREIAQQLCKEMTPEKRAPLKKTTKWEISQNHFSTGEGDMYMFGRSSSNAGLLMLLDKGTRTMPWRCITSTQV
uniref:Uncharacterized protein n=1 Tax=Kalanchoe fedtschenkoi TaxID=63787 RepID=A0A7N0UEK3_KALFE